MRDYIFILLLCLSVSFSGCVRTVQTGPDTTDLVKHVIADHSSHQRAVLSSFNPSSPDGNIVIADASGRASAMADKFLGCDYFDNIDASGVPDLLPDFAGEVIAPMPVVLPSDEDALRDLAVSSLIAALDSVYDAKVLVVSAPALSSTGVFDVDTLLRSTGTQVPVVYPLQLAASQVSGSVAVLASKDVPAGFYKQVFGPDVFVCSYEESLELGPLRSLIYEFGAANTGKLLSAIVIDDYSFTSSQIMEEWDQLLAEEPVKGIKLIDTREVAVKACFKVLRDRNIFTHRIAYPQLRKDV